MIERHHFWGNVGEQQWEDLGGQIAFGFHAAASIHEVVVPPRVSVNITVEKQLVRGVVIVGQPFENNKRTIT